MLKFRLIASFVWKYKKGEGKFTVINNHMS